MIDLPTVHLPQLRLDPVIRQLRRRAGELACSNPFYNWSLGGDAADHIIFTPGDTWPGDAMRGKTLCGGIFVLEGEQVPMHGDCWEPAGIGKVWLAHMHGFSWLRDLRTQGGDEARRKARGLIESWLGRYRNWSGFAWAPGLTGRRVANWLSLYDFYGASATPEFQHDLAAAIIRQGRHLSRSLPGSAEGLEKLYGVRGLAFAGLAFADRRGWLEQALDLLQTETKKQILPDGAHVSRSPQQLLEALKIYVDIRAALLAAGYPAPEQVTHTIDRMAQALRFFRYADKGFAVFNGAQEGDAVLADAVLSRANAGGKILSELPYAGYHRLTVGRSVVMMDTGAPPAWPHEISAHAAPLAFEFSYGRERVFVSCGAHMIDDPWKDALRATAAHNTVCIDHRNACEIRDDGHFGRRPRKITVERQDIRGMVLVEASHDGYVPINGIAHRRRLYLADHGHDLRGEENLTCITGLNKPAEIALRFHLHPRVLVSVIQDGREALLRLQGGAGWRFFHTGGHLALENSIYLGSGSRPMKTKQLVIYGAMESDSAQIKWALQREGGV